MAMQHNHELITELPRDAYVALIYPPINSTGSMLQNPELAPCDTWQHLPMNELVVQHPQDTDYDDPLHANYGSVNSYGQSWQSPIEELQGIGTSHEILAPLNYETMTISGYITPVETTARTELSQANDQFGNAFADDSTEGTVVLHTGFGFKCPSTVISESLKNALLTKG